MAGNFLSSAVIEEAPVLNKNWRVFLEMDKAHSPSRTARAKSVGRWVRAPVASSGCGSTGRTGCRVEGQDSPARPLARVAWRSWVKLPKGTWRLWGGFFMKFSCFRVRPNVYRACWNSALIRYTPCVSKEQCSFGRMFSWRMPAGYVTFMISCVSGQVLFFHDSPRITI